MMKPKPTDYDDAVRLIESLEQLLATAREARRRAEAERDQLRNGEAAAYFAGRADVQEMLERAEQAERERDEARHWENTHRTASQAWETSAMQQKAARERAEATVAELREQVRTQAESLQHLQERLARAEADNAALIERLSRHLPACDWQGCGGTCDATGRKARCVFCRQRDQLSAHPGAALLEYVQALKKVREAVEPYRFEAAHYVGLADGSSKEEALVDSCAAADALEIGRES